MLFLVESPAGRLSKPTCCRNLGAALEFLVSDDMAPKINGDSAGGKPKYVKGDAMYREWI